MALNWAIFFVNQFPLNLHFNTITNDKKNFFHFVDHHQSGDN